MLNNVTMNNKGSNLIIVLVLLSLFLIIVTGAISLGLLQKKLNLSEAAKAQALYIAESGVNYYRWVLYHDNFEYCNKETCIGAPDYGPYGPYEVKDDEGRIIGYYELYINPPPLNGSTLVDIKSVGWTTDYPKIKRTVVVKCGRPSLAAYSFLTDESVWFGNDEHLKGKAHSNVGIRMDGMNDSLVTSARPTYICLSGHNCDTQSTCRYPCNWTSNHCECPGVWGAGPNYDLWNYSVPEVDFDIDTDVLRMKAQSSGIFIESSGEDNYGYHIIFSEGSKLAINIVNSLKDPIKQLNDDWNGSAQLAEEIKSEIYLDLYDYPSNGLMFIEDNVWIEGKIDGRLTLVAAKEAQEASIYINSSINYKEKDGNHILGLIAQKDIKVPRHAPTNLSIDGILFARNGRVFRNYYYSERLVKNSIVVYGGIISRRMWNWTWVSGGQVIDGYRHTESNYDPFVTYSPPPHFPTSGEYKFISWKEIEKF